MVCVSGAQFGYKKTAVLLCKYSSTDTAKLEYLYISTGVPFYPASWVPAYGTPIHTAKIQKKVVYVMLVVYNSLLLRCFNRFLFD